MDIADLDAGTLPAAAELVARQQQAGRRLAPGLPAAFGVTDRAAAALDGLLRSGHRGLVARQGSSVVGVLVGRAEDGYAEMPAEGFAIDPAHTDPTQVLGLMYAELATGFVASGALRHYLDHVALPELFTAVTDMGFGRHHYFAVRSVSEQRNLAGGAGGTAVTTRPATVDDLEAIARLCLVEIRFRSTPPIFSPPENPTLDEVIAAHHALHDAGATHLVAEVDGVDVGVLTLEPSTGMARLCPADQPFIGETATLPSARGIGVGSALVEAAVDWAADTGAEWISVDFQPQNPLSRRFWLNSGFVPTGYGVVRAIHPSHHPSVDPGGVGS